MKPTSFVDVMRGIRDEVNREMATMSYDEWERKASREVARFPKLMAILDRTTKPDARRNPSSHSVE